VSRKSPSIPRVNQRGESQSTPGKPGYRGREMRTARRAVLLADLTVPVSNLPATESRLVKIGRKDSSLIKSDVFLTRIRPRVSVD
jgi:hypothetical protein